MPLRLLWSRHLVLILALTCLLGPAAPRAVGAAWPGNPFSPSSVWNRPLRASAPLARDSAALSRDLVEQVDSAGPWIDTWQYSVPVYVVGRRQSRRHVALDTDAPALQSAFDAVPVPRGATAAPGSDEQMVVWQPSTDRMWEFWHMHKVDGSWHASWGGEMEHVSKSPGYFANSHRHLNWGATATGLPLLGGLITFADLRRGAINHAVALAIPHAAARVWAWPAQRTDGDLYAGSTPQIPEGTRLRLDPRLNLSALRLSGLGLMIARAAQRYGIIIRDKAGTVTFYGQQYVSGADPWPAAMQNSYPSQALAGFPWEDLQVVRARDSCCWSPG